MASPEFPTDVQADDLPPPRPTTPPIRRGFVYVFALISLATVAVYGIPALLEQSGYAYEKGRARASVEALSKLDQGGALARASELFRLASQAVSPAVVHIQTQSFGENGSGRRSLGSGVVIDKDGGLIVTNHHVIQEADVITVRVGRQTEMLATLVGDDPKTDLAVIRVQGNLPMAASWGDSDALEPGDWVLAVGSPLGLERTVSAGIISATARHNLPIVGATDSYENFLQTDVAINPGNSGGPLVNLRGQVVGINTAISLVSADHNEGNQGIGFAISATLARRVVEQLAKAGRVIRGFLGVGPVPMSPEQAKQLNVPEQEGALLGLVLPASPAAKAGLRPQDVIVAIGGRRIKGPAELRDVASNLDAGSQPTVEYIRDGRPEKVDVTIAELPADSLLAYFGFNVKDVEPDPRLGAVAVDKVVPGSPAAQAGLTPGTRVLGIAPGRRVFSKAQFDVLAAQFGGSGFVPLVVVRDGQPAILNIGTPPPPPPADRSEK